MSDAEAGSTARRALFTASASRPVAWYSQGIAAARLGRGMLIEIDAIALAER